MNNKILQIKNLTATTKTNKKILDNLNYTFEKGKTYAIMGRNGCGKSTFSKVLLGHPEYNLDPKSEILFEDQDITNLEIENRAKLGINMTFQSPLSLSGVTIYQLIQKALPEKTFSEIFNKINNLAQELHIDPELLNRPLNENASGGERKKMEILQIFMLKPKLIIFDEIDTGVDVDSLKTITQFIKKHQDEKTYIIITHYNRILENLDPYKVIVLSEGKIHKEGNKKLALEIENQGYQETL